MQLVVVTKPKLLININEYFIL